MRRIGLVVVLSCSMAAAGCSAAAGCTGSGSECLRVLFLGNSYTSINDLPGTFAALARAGGHPVEVGLVAGGGETLAGHVDSTETAASLASRSWDIVVLQEQSEIPAVTAWRQQEMTPAARALVGRVGAIGATPVLFETWGHRDGLPDGGLPGYDAMQTALNRGYTEVATELDVPVAPVGRAWAAASRLDADLELWQEDGSHPTAQGTYLAAAVFYAELFGTDPAAVVGVPGGPSVSDARELAGAAQAVVAEGPPLQLR